VGARVEGVKGRTGQQTRTDRTAVAPRQSRHTAVALDVVRASPAYPHLVNLAHQRRAHTEPRSIVSVIHRTMRVLAAQIPRIQVRYSITPREYLPGIQGRVTNTCPVFAAPEYRAE
jgi:hypothetical protein